MDLEGQLLRKSGAFGGCILDGWHLHNSVFLRAFADTACMALQQVCWKMMFLEHAQNNLRKPIAKSKQNNFGTYVACMGLGDHLLMQSDVFGDSILDE